MGLKNCLYYTIIEKPGILKSQKTSFTRTIEVRTCPNGDVFYGKDDASGKEIEQLLVLRKLRIPVPRHIFRYEEESRFIEKLPQSSTYHIFDYRPKTEF